MIQIFEPIIISLLDFRLPQVIATRRRMKAFGYEYGQLQDIFSAPKFIQLSFSINYHLMYEVEKPPAFKDWTRKVKTQRLRYLIAIGKLEGDMTLKINRSVAVVTKELNGHIIGYRIYHQR